jgi:hypothetical protein
MKKLNVSNISSTALQPIKQVTLTHIQSSYQEIFAALTAYARNAVDITTGFNILYGCKLTIAGGNYTVTEGAIYYNGEVYLVDAVGSTANPSGSDVRICKIATTYLTAANADPVTFTDSSTASVHEIRKVVIQNGTSGTSGYIGAYTSAVRVYSPNISSTNISTLSPSYGLTFDGNRSLFIDNNLTNTVLLFSFDNSFVGCTQRISCVLTDTYAISATGAADLTIEVLSAGVATVSTNSSPTLKTASGSNENVILEITYHGLVASFHRLSIKIWS